MRNLVLSVIAVLSVGSASANGFGHGHGNNHNHQNNQGQNQNLEQVAPWYKTGWYNTGDTFTHRFDQPTYVERMLISAEGSRDFAKAYVYADGEQVSLLGVPGRDPDYPVVVRKVVSAIVIKFEGYVKIRDFRIYISPSKQDSIMIYDHSGMNTPAQLGKAVLQVIGSLQEVVSVSDFNTYLLPLRQSALVLAAKGMARPLLSDNTQAQARVMVARLKAAEAYLLDQLVSNDYYSGQIQTLLFVKEKLEAIYELR